MAVLIMIAIVWFWSESCFTPQERRTRRRVTWISIGLITARNLRDLVNIDKRTRY